MIFKVFFAACICLGFLVLEAQAQNEPLNEAEKREILVRLGELRVARKEIELQRQHIARDAEQDQKEAELHARELQLAGQKQALTEQERDLWKERADTYQKSYEQILKANKRGFGCTVKKVFSFGLAHCK